MPSAVCSILIDIVVICCSKIYYSSTFHINQKKAPILTTWYHGRHGERWLCAYQMSGCFLPCLGLVWWVQLIFFEWRIVCPWVDDSFDVFCVFIAKQYTMLNWKYVTSAFPVLQVSAETLIRQSWEILQSFNCTLSGQHSRQKLLKSNIIFELQLKLLGIFFYETQSTCKRPCKRSIMRINVGLLVVLVGLYTYV